MVIAASFLLLTGAAVADPEASSQARLADLFGGGRTEAAQVERERAIEKDLSSFAVPLEIEGCSEARGKAGCSIVALRLPAAVLYRCDTPMIVEETVVQLDGTKRAANIAMIRLRPTVHRTSSGEMLKPASRGAVDALAVVLKDAPGLYNECIGGTLSTDDASYEIALADDRKADLGLGVIGGLLGGTRPSEPRTIFGALACTLTGCEERRSIAVTVRGGGRKLPIYVEGNATRFSTDETFNMPVRSLPSLSVRDEEGRIVPVSKCRLYNETRHSRTYQCGPNSNSVDSLGLFGREH